MLIPMMLDIWQGKSEIWIFLQHSLEEITEKFVYFVWNDEIPFSNFFEKFENVVTFERILSGRQIEPDKIS